VNVLLAAALVPLVYVVIRRYGVWFLTMDGALTPEFEAVLPVAAPRRHRVDRRRADVSVVG
jgi:hypothetical protein